MIWLTASDYKMPDKSAATGDFILAYDVRSDLMNATTNFLGDIGPQYASPETYTEAMIVWAQSLVHFGNFTQPGWNAMQSAIVAAFSCFDMLKKMRVNPTSEVSIYDAWTKGKTDAAQSIGDGTNTATGPSAVGSGTIFGGSK